MKPDVVLGELLTMPLVNSGVFLVHVTHLTAHNFFVVRVAGVPGALGTYQLPYGQEGETWLRGAHAADSVEVLALRSAHALDCGRMAV